MLRSCQTPRKLPITLCELRSLKTASLSLRGAMARRQDHGCQPQDLSFVAEGDRGIPVKGALGFGVCSAPAPDPPAQTLSTFLALSSQNRGVLWTSRYQTGNSHNPREAERHFCASSLPRMVLL